MANEIRSLIDEKNVLLEQARAIVLKSESEKRADLTSEEEETFNRITDEMSNIDKRLARFEKIAKASQTVTDITSEILSRGSKDKDLTNEARAFQAFLMKGSNGLSEQERRDLIVGSSPDGGYLVPKETLLNTLIKFVDDFTFIRQLSSVYQLPNSQSLGALSLDTDPSDAEWTSEQATGTTDTSMAFGKRALKPSPLAKKVKISNALLRQATIPIESFVMQRLAYKFAIAEEKAFLLGNGANQPLGVMTASASGIPTSRDVSTGNSSTAVAYEGLIDALYSLKVQYHDRVAWIFHRDLVKNLLKIKDSNGNFIWQGSIQAGRPDILLNRPVYMSEYMSNTFTTGLYVGIVGDFSSYYIADSLEMELQVLKELYAAEYKTGYHARKETDGMPVLAEAFARIKLA